MKGTPRTLFDKLLSDTVGTAQVVRLNVDQVKDSVAFDLEALLNTRAVISEDLLRAYPECNRSIVSYGLTDFAGLSLVSLDDRAAVCRSLERTISRHEPRLRNVRATLELSNKSINRLNFSITASLMIQDSKEPVLFDAVLTPSSLQYAISSARHTAQRIGV
jgi:type VI secretion system protein ImpF